MDVPLRVAHVSYYRLQCTSRGRLCSEKPSRAPHDRRFVVVQRYATRSKGGVAAAAAGPAAAGTASRSASVGASSRHSSAAGGGDAGGCGDLRDLDAALGELKIGDQHATQRTDCEPTVAPAVRMRWRRRATWRRTAR